MSTATVVLAAPPPEWSVCSFLRAEEVDWLVDSTKPVESVEQPAKHKKSNGYVTYSCYYRSAGGHGAFAALTVLFAPDAGGKEAEGIEGATREWANITPLSGIGDGAATYTDPKNPSKRFITATKRIGQDSVMIYFNANTPTPDEVAPRLPDLARNVLAQIRGR